MFGHVHQIESYMLFVYYLKCSNCVFKKTYDYRLFATELRKLSSNEFIVSLFIVFRYCFCVF